MSTLRHPNIVQFIGIVTLDMVAIIVEFMPNGTVLDVLCDSDLFELCSWADPKLKMVIDLARGMNYLHTNRHYNAALHKWEDEIMHRDLKVGHFAAIVDRHLGPL